MLQTSGDVDLAQEALGSDRGGEVWMEHFERHGAIMPDVVRQVYDGQTPAAAELALDRVTVGDSL